MQESPAGLLPKGTSGTSFCMELERLFLHKSATPQEGLSVSACAVLLLLPPPLLPPGVLVLAAPPAIGRAHV